MIDKTMQHNVRGLERRLIKYNSSTFVCLFTALKCLLKREFSPFQTFEDTTAWIWPSMFPIKLGQIFIHFRSSNIKPGQFFVHSLSSKIESGQIFIHSLSSNIKSGQIAIHFLTLNWAEPLLHSIANWITITCFSIWLMQILASLYETSLSNHISIIDCWESQKLNSNYI